MAAQSISDLADLREYTCYNDRFDLPIIPCITIFEKKIYMSTRSYNTWNNSHRLTHGDGRPFLKLMIKNVYANTEMILHC